MIDFITLKSANAAARIYAKADILDHIEKNDFVRHYIPSVSLNIGEDTDYDCTIHIETSNANHIDINYPHAYYHFSDPLNLADVITLTEFMLERARQEKGIICLHGAVSIINDQAYAFLGGASGIGKSSLAYELAHMRQGTFLYDEKMLINLNTLKLVGGVGALYVSNQYWADKTGINIGSKMDLKSQTAPNFDINSFVFPVLSQTGTEAKKSTLSSDKLEWHLWEESCRKIRATSRRFFNYSTPVQSLDTEKVSLWRSNQIKILSKDVTGSYVTGNISKACLKI